MHPPSHGIPGGKTGIPSFNHTCVKLRVQAILPLHCSDERWIIGAVALNSHPYHLGLVTKNNWWWCPESDGCGSQWTISCQNKRCMLFEKVTAHPFIMMGKHLRHLMFFKNYAHKVIELGLAALFTSYNGTHLILFKCMAVANRQKVFNFMSLIDHSTTCFGFSKLPLKHSRKTRHKLCPKPHNFTRALIKILHRKGLYNILVPLQENLNPVGTLECVTLTSQRIVLSNPSGLWIGTSDIIKMESKTRLPSSLQSEAKMSQRHLVRVMSFGARVCKLVQFPACVRTLAHPVILSAQLSVMAFHTVLIVSNNWFKLNWWEKQTLVQTPAETIIGKNILWGVLSSLIYALPKIMEKRGPQTNTGARSNGAIKMLWHHFWGALMSSIFVHSLKNRL